MHPVSSTPRKGMKFKLAIATGLAGSIAFSGALLAGVTPALAAELATQPDTQIAVFMVPVTILVMTMMFEVGRFVWRNRVPASSSPPRRRRDHWPASDGQ